MSHREGVVSIRRMEGGREGGSGVSNRKKFTPCTKCVGELAALDVAGYLVVAVL